MLKTQKLDGCAGTTARRAAYVFPVNENSARLRSKLLNANLAFAFPLNVYRQLGRAWPGVWAADIQQLFDGGIAASGEVRPVWR